MSAEANPSQKIPAMPPNSSAHFMKMLEVLLDAHEKGELSAVLFMYQRTNGQHSYSYSNCSPQGMDDMWAAFKEANKGKS